MVAPVSGMAVGAFFHNGRMFEEEGATFFRMTTIAEIIDGIRLEELGGWGAMRVVAARALHLSFAQRMMRKSHLLRCLLFVALAADVALHRLGQKMPVGYSF